MSNFSDGIWSAPEYAAADDAYQAAMLVDANDPMSALADAVNAAFAARPIEPKWQSMDTAPLDKTEILLTNGAVVTPARFLSGKWMTPGYSGTNVQFHPTGWQPFPSAGDPASPTVRDEFHRIMDEFLDRDDGQRVINQLARRIKDGDKFTVDTVTLLLSR